jgi:hypothetical protein
LRRRERRIDFYRWADGEIFGVGGQRCVDGLESAFTHGNDSDGDGSERHLIVRWICGACLMMFLIFFVVCQGNAANF